MFRRLRELVRDVWIEAMEPPAKRPDRSFDVDCPDHGKTFLNQSRRTACCGSLQWIASGDVESRIVSDCLCDHPYRGVARYDLAHAAEHHAALLMLWRIERLPASFSDRVLTPSRIR